MPPTPATALVEVLHTLKVILIFKHKFQNHLTGLGIGFAHGKVDPVEAGRMGGHASAGSNSNSSSGGSSGPGGNIFNAIYICRD